MKKNPLLVLAFIVLFSCNKNDHKTIVDNSENPDQEELPIANLCETISYVECLDSYPQRQGNPEEGYKYLVTGDYIKSGVPYDLYLTAYGEDNKNYLNRTGDNAIINHEYTAINAPNGVRVVAFNCLQCHAQTLNNEFVLGLGNSVADFTKSQSTNVNLLHSGISALYGNPSPELTAAEKFLTALKAIGPHVMTDVRGVNPADKIAAILASHRSSEDFTWNPTPLLEVPSEVVPSDVPAWWLLKKKNAMFYTGVARQDFVRFMMASSLLTVDNIDELNEIDNSFVDVLAYINTLEAPVYPESISASQADKGKIIFTNNCASCHGTYGNEETYPNIIIPTSYVGTDPLLSQENYDNPIFLNWFNESWFGNGDNAGKLVSTGGYIAPPLDGIWATAPYLHNGSVPTLEDLLKSAQRPTYWKRSFDTNDYDFNKLGWNYTEQSGANTGTYDTTKAGYGNYGHTYGDGFTDTERSNLIEYLKTL